ncbi:Xenotropic and polytropic retrovirus receptor 1-like [Hondaea fermentalgiana]|uniref:Xenotropic and polytropic retrovirus receptor 1-like n=1 Tax=Hondaea fermentalgiana TaxID=2315210 RepID=A0A2R5GK15_9STRA|nr:Xenotropic and polytropic retrovirus receptor 1-like [Hondaea fermentalgiana]|eukprot:GBG28204.1 Xenotropic and polytropic retrovirus receptor 1-like [Hondaea fermentalgiana]
MAQVASDVVESHKVSAVKDYPRLDKCHANLKRLERLAREVGVEQGKRKRSNSLTGMRAAASHIRGAACCLCERLCNKEDPEDALEEDVEEAAEDSSLLSHPKTSYDGAPREPKVEEFVAIFEQEVDQVSETLDRELKEVKKRLDLAEKECLDSKMSQIARRDAFGPEFTEINRLAHYLSAFGIRNYSTLLAVLCSKDVAETKWRARDNQLLGDLLRNECLDQAGFAKAQGGVDDILERITKFCADEMYNGNRQLAEFAILEKRRQAVEWDLVFVGVWCGLALGLSCWALYVVVFDSVMQTETFQKSDGLRIYRALGAILLFGWGIAFQIAAWRESRINFPVIFSIPSKHFPATRQLFRWAAIASIVYLINLTAFVKELRNVGDKDTAGFFPALLLIMFIFACISLWGYLIFIPQIRKVGGFRTALKQNFMGLALFVVGLSEGGFLTAYISDYLTSSTKILVDLAYIVCSFSLSGPSTFLEDLTRDSEACRDSFPMTRVIVPIITCWPLWLRLGQNLSRLAKTGKQFPFLVNAMKYGFSHTIVIFSAMKPELLDLDSDSDEVPMSYRVIFVGIFALTSLLMFSWDVGMDWGLGRAKHKFLRKRLMLSTMWHGSRFPYYIFIVLDFFLRYLWTVTLLPSMTLGKTWLFSTTPLIMFEVMRRTMWGLIRVENEHLSNTRGYRANGFIPLYFSTWQESTPAEPSADSGGDEAEKDDSSGAGHANDKAAAASFFGVIAEVLIFVLIVVGLAIVAIFL